MSFFKQPKPRRFHHVTMFYDEHTDRVRDIEQRARKELGMEKAYDKKTANGRMTEDPYGIRGTFSESLNSKKSRRGNLGFVNLSTNSGAIFIILLILLLVWLYLSR